MKSIFDFLVATIMVVLFSPVFAAVAVLIKIEDGGPVFYRGARVGKDGGMFRMFKFRTMVVNAEQVGGSSTSDDDPRITRIGRFLRKFKIDELPQLVNILLGEMSFVGPRPQVASDVALYTEEEREILSVLPGITDYASIEFHNEGEILEGHPDPDRGYVELIRPEKIRLQLHYVRTRSFLVDMKILAATASTLFRTRS